MCIPPIDHTVHSRAGKKKFFSKRRHAGCRMITAIQVKGRNMQPARQPGMLDGNKKKKEKMSQVP
jgi:hypothetical protein